MVSRHRLRLTCNIIEHDADMRWAVKLDDPQLLLMGRWDVGLMINIDRPAALHTRIAWR